MPSYWNLIYSEKWARYRIQSSRCIRSCGAYINLGSFIDVASRRHMRACIYIDKECMRSKGPESVCSARELWGAAKNWGRADCTNREIGAQSTAGLAIRFATVCSNLTLLWTYYQNRGMSAALARRTECVYMRRFYTLRWRKNFENSPGATNRALLVKFYNCQNMCSLLCPAAETSSFLWHCAR